MATEGATRCAGPEAPRDDAGKKLLALARSDCWCPSSSPRDASHLCIESRGEAGDLKDRVVLLDALNPEGGSAAMTYDWRRRTNRSSGWRMRSAEPSRTSCSKRRASCTTTSSCKRRGY